MHKTESINYRKAFVNEAFTAMSMINRLSGLTAQRLLSSVIGIKKLSDRGTDPAGVKSGG